jgi:hypothetical protein
MADKMMHNQTVTNVQSCTRDVCLIKMMTVILATQNVTFLRNVQLHPVQHSVESTDYIVTSHCSCNSVNTEFFQDLGLSQQC